MKFSNRFYPLSIFSRIVLLSAVVALAGADEPNPPTPTQPVMLDLSPFGIGSDAHTGRTLDKWIPQMASIGIGVLRTTDTPWFDVEPQEGQWKWDTLDAQMDMLEKEHIKFGGLLFVTPEWDVQDKPGGYLPVNNVAAWSTYVSEVVKHVHGRIKYWEVWNEPPNFIGSNQTPDDYAKIVVAAYNAAKAADPTCLVSMSAKSVHINYLEQVIKAGAMDHFDYVTLHPYETLGTTMDHRGTEAVFMNIVPTLRKMLAAQDPARVNAPVWVTELGYDAAKNADTPAYALVKAYTMGIAQGIACISWFEGIDGDSGPMGLLQADGTPRPAYTAMAQMIKYFGDHPAYLGWVLLNGKDYAFVFQGAKGTVLVTWAPREMSDHLELGEKVSVVNPKTGEVAQTATYDLTDSPILIDGVPGSLVAQAKANRAKPFPWGGDYTNAKSVSVTMGEKNIEKGLHTQSAASIAADVILYGGAARSGTVPGGNVFMVDPNFLCYTPTPIEITAIVRRETADTPATLDLTYESTSGEKHAAPYAIPADAGWHTATWRIDDDEFVAMYGFNFRLNSDKYGIQKITVTKLDH